MKNLKKSANQGNTNNYFFNKIKVLPIACFIACISCSKDDATDALGNCASSNWVQLVEQELTDWSNAATVYGTDETTANCNNYKSAANNYLNALDKIKDCVPGTGLNEFNQSIQEAKNEINQLVCP